MQTIKNIISENKNSFEKNVNTGWGMVKLGEISSYTKGFAFKSANYLKEGTRVVRISDTNAHSIKDENPIFVNNKDNKYNKWKLLENDLIFTTVGSKPPMYDSMVGKVIRVSKKHEGALLNQNAVILRGDESKVNQLFLYNNFKIKKYLNFIETIVRGNANQVSITLKELFNYEIPLPPLKEQKKIAQILSTWDESIETTQSLIKKLQLRKKGLMQQLLSGEKRLAGFSDEWKVLKGNILFASTSNKQHNGVGEVLSATQDKGVIPRSETGIDIKYDKKSLSNYKKVEIGDFVISLRSFQGGIEYSNYEGLVSPAYTVLQESLPISKMFYREYMKTENFINRLNSIIYGIRDGKQISYKEFGTLKFNYPPLEEQKAISKIIEIADEEILDKQLYLDKLQEQKKGLMQQLLTGQKRVK